MVEASIRLAVRGQSRVELAPGDDVRLDYMNVRRPAGRARELE